MAVMVLAAVTGGDDGCGVVLVVMVGRGRQVQRARMG